MADKKKSAAKPDLATIGGLILAFGGILGGLVLEGGKIRDVAQITAAIIVMGGTLGAVMVTTPLDVLIRAAKKFRLVFMDTVAAPEAAIDDLILFATKARKSGIASLEGAADDIDDYYLRKAISLAVDGTDVQEIRKMMEIEITVEECRWEADAKVYEAAGGYSPTVGIIGAVLGLIQVMKHLENIDEVGHGIAVAFVATVYGVAAANLLFLPAANKIKARAAKAIEMRELMLEGVIGIAEGLNPKLIKIKLDAYIQGHAVKDKKSGVRAERAQAAAAEA
ncbi:MAG: flagellar motor protein [Acidobacteriota bacterium]|nr:flagellar motor protein [Acidobacteriota bacterium]